MYEGLLWQVLALGPIPLAEETFNFDDCDRVPAAIQWALASESEAMVLLGVQAMVEVLRKAMEWRQSAMVSLRESDRARNLLIEVATRDI